MKEKFFCAVKILLTVAFAAMAIILGVRTGIAHESVWSGISIGCAFALGIVVFVVGIWRFNKGNFDRPIANILFGISMIGISVLGVSLAAMMAENVITVLSISPVIIEWGINVGVVLFLGPILLTAAYLCCKSLIRYIDEHRKFSVITIVSALAVGVAEYFVAGGLNAAFAITFAFLFYWIGICIFVNAWRNVNNEDTRLYWRIGFGLLMAFLGCGIIYVFSEIFVNVSTLHSILSWIARKVGMISLYSLMGYTALVFLKVFISNIWRKLVNWAR